ncbi:MAG: hypothetical protein ACHQFW_00105 [Chitinophagales bacterium]
MSRGVKLLILLLLPLAFIISCHTDTTPKPSSYPRIFFPEMKELVTYDDPNCPYTFQLPDYYIINKNVTYFNETPEDPCWLNLICSDLNATIYLSYKELTEKQKLQQLVEDAYKLTYKHSSQADFIQPQEIENEYGVHGLIYYVGGDAASNFQFFVTDTISNFVRGSLYFNNRPNADSLKPVVQFLVNDIQGMLSTWKWRLD